MSKKMTVTTAREAMYRGLNNRGKKRMEFLTVTVRPELKIFINEKFELLVDRLNRYMNKWGRKTEVKYLKVTVYQEERSHIHAFIVKPWVFPDELIRMWEEIIGFQGEGSIRCKTITKDKTDRRAMNKIVKYMLTQSDEHEGSQMEFTHSNNWELGIMVSVRERIREIGIDQKVIEG